MFLYCECSGYKNPLQAKSMEEAKRQAKQWLEEGDWGDGGIHVEAMILEVDQEEAEIDRDYVRVYIPPKETNCKPNKTHLWEPKNPGVWSCNGAIISHELCRHCRCQRITTTGFTGVNAHKNGVSYHTP